MGSYGPDATSIGKTLTSGIQDISALLPLLGTEQCEQHVGSALTGGYLYVAATPMSIFGSLGIAKAGFKALLASVSIRQWRFVGAEKLRDTGFMPSGENLSLIMMDPENKSRHLAETRLDSLLKELHIEDVERLSVSSSCETWNARMILLTATLCILSLTPYVHLGLRRNNLSQFACWTLPIIRALGGFLTATTLQLLTQRRLLVILKKRLIFHSLNLHVTSWAFDKRNNGTALPFKWDLRMPSETCLWDLEELLSCIDPPPSPHQREPRSLRTVVFRLLGVKREHIGDISPNHSSDILEKCSGAVPPILPTCKSPAADVEYGQAAHRQGHDKLEALTERLAIMNHAFPTNESVWYLLVLLLLGIAGSVVGYLGCFGVVQGTQYSTGPLIWIFLEGALSIIRMVLWGWNPDGQQPDPFKIALTLKTFAPLSTCNRSYDAIMTHNEFEGQEPGMGYVIPFVRAPEFLESITSFAGLLKHFDHPNISLFYTYLRKAAYGKGVEERVLFIIIFDHKERTTRVYREEANGESIFEAAEPLILDDFDHHHDRDSVANKAKGYPLKTRVNGGVDPDDDPVVGNRDLRAALQAHYRSIVDQMRFRIRNPSRTIDVIKNSWTIKLTDTSSSIGRDAARGADYHKSSDGQYNKVSSGSKTKHEDRGNADHNVGDDHLEGRIGLEEQDDVEYVRQGYLEQRRTLLRELRGQQILSHIMRTRKETQLKLEMATGTVHSTETNICTLRDTLDRLLVAERAAMEHILVIEMWHWEKGLRKCYDKMVARIIKNQTSDRNAEYLERRLKKDWIKNAQDRLAEDLDVRSRTLGKFGFPLMIVRGKESEFAMGMQEAEESWSKTASTILDCWNSIQTATTRQPSQLSAAFWKLESSIHQLRTGFVFQVPVENEFPASWNKLLNERLRAVSFRLFHADQEMRERVARDGLVDFYHPPVVHMEPTMGITFGGRWACVFVQDMHEDTAFHTGRAAVALDLQRKRHINLLQLGTFGDRWPPLDAEFVLPEPYLRLVKDTSLTTLLLPHPNIAEQTVAVLEEVVNQHPNITGICGVDPKLERLQAVLAQRSTTVPFHSTSLTASGFLVSTTKCQAEYVEVLESLYGGDMSKMELRFIGPKKGSLTLRLYHRYFGSGQAGETITIQSLFTSTHTVSSSEAFVLEEIELHPGVHFYPDSPILLAIIPLSKGYQVRDLDLVDEDGLPYIGPSTNAYEVDAGIQIMYSYGFAFTNVWYQCFHWLFERPPERIIERA